MAWSATLAGEAVAAVVEQGEHVAVRPWRAQAVDPLLPAAALTAEVEAMAQVGVIGVPQHWQAKPLQQCLKVQLPPPLGSTE